MDNSPVSLVHLFLLSCLIFWCFRLTTFLGTQFLGVGFDIVTALPRPAAVMEVFFSILIFFFFFFISFIFFFLVDIHEKFLFPIEFNPLQLC